MSFNASHQRKVRNEMSTTTFKTQVQVQMKRFDEHIVSTVADTIWTGYSTDCTIRSKDKAFSCHRVILSMASPFFSQLFDSAAPGRVPEIIIPDASSEVLQMIINIIYTGESWVPVSSRQEFIDICRLLQLKGYEDFYEATADVACSDPFESSVENIVVEEGQVDEIVTQYDDTVIDYDEPMDEISESNLSMPTPIIVRTRPTRVVNTSTAILKIDPALKVPEVPGVPIVYSQTMGQGVNKRVELREDEIVNVYNRLLNLFMKTYKNILTKATNLETLTYNVELSMNGNSLVYGVIYCGLCKLRMEIPYIQTQTGGFKQWTTIKMLKHLQKVHNNLK